MIQAPTYFWGKCHPFHPFRYGIALGEVLLWAAFLGFCIFWVVYWRVIFTYTADVKLASETVHVQEEIAARLLGHMTNLLSALLLFPVSRTGLWVDVFGVPYDRCIKYHRLLGLLAYVLVTLHAWVWWNKWASEGSLGANILSFNSISISPSRGTLRDFTIPIVEFAWFLLTASLLSALLLRRKLYPIFRYTHQYIGAIYYVAALLHAWSFW